MIQLDNNLKQAATDYANKILSGEFHPSWSDAFKQNVAKGSYEDFIAGATSDAVNIQHITALINENESILEMLRIHSGDDRLMMPIRFRIQSLNEQLKEFQKSNI
jgi:hypothetical protein